MMALLRRMAAEGCAIVFSSHILDEVERLAEQVLVIVSGRLAASGDFRAIRRLMTDRPHSFTVASTNNRAFAQALVADPTVMAVELSDSKLIVRTSQFAEFIHAAPRIARDSGITIQELLPTSPRECLRLPGAAMNREIFTLTMREFIGQRRSLLILLLAVIPVGLAVIFQLGDAETRRTSPPTSSSTAS